MKEAARKAWSKDDQIAALTEFRRLWPDCPHGCEPQTCAICFNPRLSHAPSKPVKPPNAPKSSKPPINTANKSFQNLA
jgi:hypothetical protein